MERSQYVSTTQTIEKKLPNSVSLNSLTKEIEKSNLQRPVKIDLTSKLKPKELLPAPNTLNSYSVKT